MFYFILSGNERMRAVDQVENDLGLTYYMVDYSFKELNQDLIDIYKETGGELCQLQKVGNRYYQITGIVETVVSRLFWFYGARSKLFILLNNIFTSQKFTPSKHSQDNFLSSASVYIAKNELRDFLLDYNIQLSNAYRLVGDEFSIRQLLFSIYFGIYKEFEYPFKKQVEVESTIFLETVINDFNIELTSGDRSKLLLYLSVLFIRLQSKNIMQTEEAYFYPSSKQSATANYLQKRFKLNDETSNIELQNIQWFLEAEKLLPFCSTLFCYETEKETVELANLFIKNLTNQDIETENDHPMETMLSSRVQEIFRYLILCSSKRVDHLFYLRQADVYFFYPTHYYLCKNFLEKHYFKESRSSLHSVNYKFLLLNFLTSITNLFEVSHLRYRIKVKLDFISGKLYQDEIENLIKHMIDLPISITFKQSEADLIITDRYHKHKKSNQVINWTYPATIHDWSHLTNAIIHFLNSKISDEGEKNFFLSTKQSD